MKNFIRALRRLGVNNDLFGSDGLIMKNQPHWRKSPALGGPPDRGPGLAWERALFKKRLPPGNLTRSKSSRYYALHGR